MAPILWGDEMLEPRAADFHFLTIGATGSGKTIVFRRLMQSVLPAIGKAKGLQAVIYDSKQEFYSHAARMVDQDEASDWSVPRSTLQLLDPFDSRGVAWAIGEDVVTPSAARQLAATLCPEDSSASNPFFSRAAQEIVYGAILSFVELRHKENRSWFLRDLIVSLTTDWKTAKAVLMRSPSRLNAGRIETYLKTRNDMTLSVWATLQTRLAPFEPVASAWSAADPAKSVSLRRWVEEREPSVLVLRVNPSVREATDLLNRLIIRRLSETLLDQPDQIGVAPGEARRTWIFLDEFREAGKLEGVRNLFNMGRSKGVTLAIGLQDIQGLKAEYGESEALEILGQCGNKAFLRLESPETAQWVSSTLGIVREPVKSTQVQVQTVPQVSISQTESSQEVDRPMLLPTAFLGLPVTNPENGLRGYFKYFNEEIVHERRLKPFGPEEKGPDGALLPKRLWEPHRMAANVVARDPALQWIKPWSPSERTQWGIDSLDGEMGEGEEPPINNEHPKSELPNPLESMITRDRYLPPRTPVDDFLGASLVERLRAVEPSILIDSSSEVSAAPFPFSRRFLHYQHEWTADHWVHHATFFSDGDSVLLDWCEGNPQPPGSTAKQVLAAESRILKPDEAVLYALWTYSHARIGWPHSFSVIQSSNELTWYLDAEPGSREKFDGLLIAPGPSAPWIVRFSAFSPCGPHGEKGAGCLASVEARVEPSGGVAFEQALVMTDIRAHSGGKYKHVIKKASEEH